MIQIEQKEGTEEKSKTALERSYRSLEKGMESKNNT
jgi:hypothetical protein